MNKIFIGKVVNTHGIKGEIRILSDFPYKDKVFILNDKEVREKLRYENIREGDIHYVDDSSGEIKVLHEQLDWWVDYFRWF